MSIIALSLAEGRGTPSAIRFAGPGPSVPGAFLFGVVVGASVAFCFTASGAFSQPRRWLLSRDADFPEARKPQCLHFVASVNSPWLQQAGRPPDIFPRCKFLGRASRARDYAEMATRIRSRTCETGTRYRGGLGGGAPQPPEATVVSICSLHVSTTCCTNLTDSS